MNTHTLWEGDSRAYIYNILESPDMPLVTSVRVSQLKRIRTYFLSASLVESFPMGPERKNKIDLILCFILYDQAFYHLLNQ